MSAPGVSAPTRQDIRDRLVRDWRDALGTADVEMDEDAVQVAVSVALWAASRAAAEAYGHAVAEQARPVVSVGRTWLVEHVVCSFCGYGPLPDEWRAPARDLGMDAVYANHREDVLCGFCRHGSVVERWLRNCAAPADVRNAQDSAHQANVIRAEVLAR